MLHAGETAAAPRKARRAARTAVMAARLRLRPTSRADSRLRPSDPAAMKARRSAAGESIALRARALQRGVLVHRLLQSLPDVAADRRRDARAYDTSPATPASWTEAEREALARKVLALIADASALRRCSPPAAAPRCPIVGRLERPGRPPALVSGQIDRLVVTPAEVLIVDYKTNHAPPREPRRGAPGLRPPARPLSGGAQRLYPQRPVRAALLWTETPDLMEISTPALDAGHAILIIDGVSRA